MEAQLQIRHNAQEAQEYVTDLLDWQNTIKRKAPANAAPSSSAPAVRGRADGTISAPAPELQQPALGPKGASSTATASSKPSSSHPAAHTYKNYSKWDKFNVDAALDETEADMGPVSSSSSGPAAPTVPSPANTVPTASVPPPRSITSSSSSAAAAAVAAAGVPAPPRAKEPSTALEWKDRGNKLFQAGQHQPALDCYQRSLALEPTSIAHANAAMALLKLNKHSEAEAACTAALELDPAYVKALQRRGTARKALGSFWAAAEDFEAALRLEPSNKGVLGERDACLQQHLQQQQLDASYLPTHTIPLTVEMSKPKQPEKQQLEDSSAAAPAAPGLTPVSSSKTPEAAAAAAAAVMQACLPAASRAQGVSSREGVSLHLEAAAAAAGGADGGGSHGMNGVARSSTPTQTPPAAAGAAQEPSSPQQGKAASPAGSPGKAAAVGGSQRPVAAAAAAALAGKLSGRVLGSFKQPRTSVEFESAWRALQGDVGLQAAYVAKLDVPRLPAVFKSSLTAGVMHGLAGAALRAIAAGGGVGQPQDAAAGDNAALLEPEAAVQLLQVLCKVDRFDMAAMCCTGAQRQQLGELWGSAEAAAGQALPLGLQGQLASLRSKYRL